MSHRYSIIVAAKVFVLMATSLFSVTSHATPCTFVALDPGSGDLVDSATGHGPRGCIRAKRRCERRTGLTCEPEGNVHTKNCSAAAQLALNDAFAFIRNHENELMNDFDIADRRATERRIKRRFSRKINRTRVGCGTGVLCRTNQDNRFALHAFGIAGNKIRVCYEKMLNSGYRFCNLVNTVAHEFAHSIGIKKDRAGGHSRNQDDRVYQFGDFAGNLCLAERTPTSPNYELTP